MRFGGPKYRRGIPVRRFPRRPGTWIANGLEEGTAGIDNNSSLVVPEGVGNPETYPLQTQLIQTVALAFANTQYLGPLVSSFQSHTREAEDHVSVNQADALAGDLRVSRIQGFLHIQNLTENLLRFAWIITKSDSTNTEAIDSIGFADPTLWRGHDLVWKHFGHLLPNWSDQGLPSPGWCSSMNLDLRTKVRLKAEQGLRLWVFIQNTVASSEGANGVADVMWGLRSYAKRTS